MKGINAPEQAMERGGVASFSPQGAGYLTLLSRFSFGNGTLVMLVLLSLRWGMKESGMLYGNMQRPIGIYVVIL